MSDCAFQFCYQLRKSILSKRLPCYVYHSRKNVLWAARRHWRSSPDDFCLGLLCHPISGQECTTQIRCYKSRVRISRSSVSGGPPVPYQSPKGIIIIYLVYVCFRLIYYSLWRSKQGNFVYCCVPDAPLITQWSSTTHPTHKSSVLVWKPSSMSANTLTFLCTVELKSATPRTQTQGALEAAWNVSLEALKLSMKRLTTSILWPKDRLLWIERRE